MANGESTQRSLLDADQVIWVLREQGTANLLGEEELTLILDGMELRRSGAQEQEYLMRVKALDGSLVNGYRSFNVLGMCEKTPVGCSITRSSAVGLQPFRVRTSKSGLPSRRPNKPWSILKAGRPG
jgi:hypothetical protein